MVALFVCHRLALQKGSKEVLDGAVFFVPAIAGEEFPAADGDGVACVEFLGY